MQIVLNPSAPEPSVRNNQTGSTDSAITANIAAMAKAVLEKQGHAVTIVQADQDGSVQDTAAAKTGQLFVALRCHGDASPSPLGADVWCYPDSYRGLILAKCLMRQLVRRVQLISRGVQWAVPGERYVSPLQGLGSLPAVYINLGFLTNTHDEVLLRTRQHEYAQGIACAILEYQRHYQN